MKHIGMIKNIWTLCFLLIISLLSAQDSYPKILSFESKNYSSQEIDKSLNLNRTYHFLILNESQAIDLMPFGNVESEFKLLKHNDYKFLIAFTTPSNMSGKGRCAAGTESGILELKIDSNGFLQESNQYLKESCQLSIELIEEKILEANIVKYTCQDFLSEESFSILLDTKNLSITVKAN